jgi:hypothetical protein
MAKSFRRIDTRREILHILDGLVVNQALENSAIPLAPYFPAKTGEVFSG